MIAVIRIHGQTGLNDELDETLFRLRLRKKLTLVFVDEKDEIQMGMVNAVREYVAYGPVSDELMKKVIEKRGKKVQGKLKPFIGLHPPIGGFKKSTKISYPKGVLGENKEIAKLIERML